MSDDIEEIFLNVREIIHKAEVDSMRAVGDIAASELQDRLSTPYPPASKVGEDPHLRTGNLRAGTESNVFELPDGVTVMVTSSRAGGDENVPTYLEATRKYMQRTVDSWESRLEDETAERMKEHLSE